MVAGLGVSHDITEALHNHGGQLKQEAGLGNVWGGGSGTTGNAPDWSWCTVSTQQTPPTAN